MLKLNYLCNCFKGYFKIRMEFKLLLGNVCLFNFNYFFFENGINEIEYFLWFRRVV